MKVFKCDRCGAIYHHNSEKWDAPLLYRITWNYEHSDLCDECVEKLQGWMARVDEDWRK